MKKAWMTVTLFVGLVFPLIAHPCAQFFTNEGERLLGNLMLLQLNQKHAAAKLKVLSTTLNTALKKNPRSVPNALLEWALAHDDKDYIYPLSYDARDAAQKEQARRGEKEAASPDPVLIALFGDWEESSTTKRKEIFSKDVVRLMRKYPEQAPQEVLEWILDWYERSDADATDYVHALPYETREQAKLEVFKRENNGLTPEQIESASAVKLAADLEALPAELATLDSERNARRIDTIINQILSHASDDVSNVNEIVLAARYRTLMKIMTTPGLAEKLSLSAMADVTSLRFLGMTLELTVTQTKTIHLAAIRALARHPKIAGAIRILKEQKEHNSHRTPNAASRARDMSIAALEARLQRTQVD